MAKLRNPTARDAAALFKILCTLLVCVYTASSMCAQEAAASLINSRSTDRADDEAVCWWKPKEGLLLGCDVCGGLDETATVSAPKSRCGYVRFQVRLGMRNTTRYAATRDGDYGGMRFGIGTSWTIAAGLWGPGSVQRL